VEKLQKFKWVLVWDLRQAHFSQFGRKKEGEKERKPNIL
jgi:hypothetical protein